MTTLRILSCSLLLAAAGASIVALGVPVTQEVLDEPSPSEDPFYYVDYHKRDSYRTWKELVWGLGWPVGIASGLSAGVICYVLMVRAHRKKAVGRWI